MELFSRNLRKDFFLKIGILYAKVFTKKVTYIEVEPCPAQNSVYQANHCLIIGCVNLFGRLYIIQKWLSRNSSIFDCTSLKLDKTLIYFLTLEFSKQKQRYNSECKCILKSVAIQNWRKIGKKFS